MFLMALLLPLFALDMSADDEKAIMIIPLELGPEKTLQGVWDPSDKGTAIKVIWIEEDGFNENGPTEIVVDMRYENQMDNGNLTWGSTMKYSQSNYYYNLGMDEVCWWYSPTLLYNEINENGSIFEFKFGK